MATTFDDDDESWRETVGRPSPKTNGANGTNGHTNGTNGHAKSYDNVRSIDGLPLDPPSEDHRPDVRLTDVVHEGTDAMCTAIAADTELFQRANALTEVLRAAPAPGEELAAGTPFLRPLPLSKLVDVVSRNARCVMWKTPKQGKPDWKPVAPPKTRVMPVHERGHWEGIRQLVGVVETPYLRPDGTVAQAPGYDAQTGYLFEPNAYFEIVPQMPTLEHAKAALAHLTEPFSEFPYAHPSHLAAVLASVLTLHARPAIKGSVPAFVFDASAARSGKSLQVDVVHLIATGRPASRMTYPENDEELEKILGAYAMKGVASIPFDNVARKFGGAPLDKVITAVGRVDLRVLGRSDVPSFDWRSVIFASGNNVDFRGDMLARVLCIRLESPLENPEQRDDFSRPDLRAWTLKHRVTLVRAALTLLRAYCAAGRPEMPGVSRWGGFESWARLIPHALVWAGAANPLEARRGLSGDEDPTRTAETNLVTGWETLCKAHDAEHQGMTVKQALALLYKDGRDPVDGDGLDGLRDALEELAGTKAGLAPKTSDVSYPLRKLKGSVRGGTRLLVHRGHNSVMRWYTTRA